MRISGALADAGVAEVMQLVHFGGRSGTLTVEAGERRAEVEFHRGHVVRAWASGQPRLGDLLVDGGRVGRSTLEAVREAAVAAAGGSREPERPLGRLLLEAGALSRASLREAVEEQIQRVVFEIVGWKRGTFAFAVGATTPPGTATPGRGEILPGIELDTQKLLLEAVRRLDESARPGGGEAAGGEVETAPGRLHPVVPPLDDDGLDSLEGTLSGLEGFGGGDGPPAPVQVVSPDGGLATALENRLSLHGLRCLEVPLRDAGLALPGQSPPVVLLDLRETGADAAGLGAESRDADTLATLVRLHPDAPVVALVEPGPKAAAAFDAGARAVVRPDPDEVAACLRRIAGTATATAAAPADLSVDPVVGRLRRVVGDIRSGLFSATLALSLMNLVADAAERAVLFLVRRDSLQPLGAFGFSRDSGRPLIEQVRHLCIPREEAGVLEEAVRDGQVHDAPWGRPGLPAALRERLGPPASGQALLIPVLGRERAIALIYVDNGPLWAPLRDAALLELATAQVGFAFENELLRGLLERSHGGAGPVRGGAEGHDPAGTATAAPAASLTSPVGPP